MRTGHCRADMGLVRYYIKLICLPAHKHYSIVNRRTISTTSFLLRLQKFALVPHQMFVNIEFVYVFVQLTVQITSFFMCHSLQKL